MREVIGLTPEQRIDKISDVSQLFDHEKMEPPRIFFSNTKHLELSEIKPGLTLIRSPKGSGKTESMVDIIQKAIYKKKTIDP
jgi:type II secretory ATPase GspE/PulE/Tfp pilus assembly ATPase PilB-like protein